MPGPRDHGALVSNQKDIESPGPPRHGGCHLFKRAWASCRRKTYCAEVRSVAAATPRFLGPRFRGGNERERGGNTEIVAEAGKPRKGPGLAPISLIVFPASAGIRGPRSTGWRPEGHRATTVSAARRVTSFEKNPEHRASGMSAALRSVPWQRHHRGSWAPAFARETKEERGCIQRYCSLRKPAPGVSACGRSSPRAAALARNKIY